MDDILQLRHVSLSYNGQTVVQDVTFSVRTGETLCLLGANGSGKSTLIKGILKLLPLDSGEIVRPPLNTVSYLAQIHTVDRDFPATVREIVLSGALKDEKRFFYRADDRARADRAMEKLKLTAFANRRIGSLSGGQQQRTLLARALAREPKLLVMDEPCSALDPEITAELYELFDRLRTDMGLTMVIATHDWEYAARSANRVAVMNNKLEFVGTIEEWKHWEGAWKR